MSRARTENAAALAHALGVPLEAAAQTLDKNILITAEGGDVSLARDIRDLLARSVATVGQNLSSSKADLEVVVGNAAARTAGARIYVAMSKDFVRIASTPVAEASADVGVHPIVAWITACYAAGAVIARLAGPSLPYPIHDPLVFASRDLLGEDEHALREKVNIGVVHLAGAGAIGNAFVLALGRFNVEGQMHIVDPDAVEEGNLNRTLLFTAADVGNSKATALVEHARFLLPNVELSAHVTRLQTLADGTAWLRQLISAVDSRRARRALQEELPHSVYDASTSGIEEVVLHFNSVEHIGQRACMYCLYHEDRRETAHEEHVAQMLGLTLEDVQQVFLSDGAARKVLRKHPQLTGKLVGLPCDTLFKELCSTGSLGRDSAQQVLAPLAFVSSLAGALLALEFVRRRIDTDRLSRFNEWHVSPWCTPLVGGQRSRPSRSGCSLCSRPGVVQALWGVHDAVTADSEEG